MHTSMSKRKCCVFPHLNHRFLLPQIFRHVSVVHSEVGPVGCCSVPGAGQGEWGRAGVQGKPEFVQKYL